MTEITLKQKREVVMANLMYLAMSQCPERAYEYRDYIRSAPDSWINETYEKIVNPDSVPSSNKS